MAVQVYQRNRRKSSGFPWGIALLGLGAYLYWEHQKTAAATPPSQTAVLPPATSPATLPVSTATQATLQPIPTVSPFVGTANYETAHTWAVREGQPQVLAWLETIGADDLAKFAYVTQMWSTYSYCKDQTCFNYWHEIKTKYPTVFAYKTYW